MTPLRARTIRLAHENPSLRPHLLPILREADEGPVVEIDHGYEQPLAGGTDVVKRLQDQLLVEQGRPKREPNPRLASSRGVSLFDLPVAEELMEGFRRISKVWSSEADAEQALTRLLVRAGLKESYRQAGARSRGGEDWQEWHLRTEIGDEVAEHLNVFHRPGPRPGWTSFQVST